MKAMSKVVSRSFPRHCTHGSLANVVIPEKMESAVTALQMSGSSRQKHFISYLHYRLDTWPGRDI